VRYGNSLFPCFTKIDITKTITKITKGYEDMKSVTALSSFTGFFSALSFNLLFLSIRFSYFIARWKNPFSSSLLQQQHNFWCSAAAICHYTSCQINGIKRFTLHCAIVKALVTFLPFAVILVYEIEHT